MLLAAVGTEQSEENDWGSILFDFVLVPLWQGFKKHLPAPSHWRHSTFNSHLPNKQIARKNALRLRPEMA